MYFRYWGLNDSPFRSGAEARFLYDCPTHEEALARMHFVVEERRRVGLLLGERGVGKSATLTAFARQIRATGGQVAYVNLVGQQPEEFLAALAVALGASSGRWESNGMLWRRLADRIAENRYQRLATVLLLDDADEASGGSSGINLQATLERLSILDSTAEARLALILAAKPGTVGRVGRRLLEAADLKIELDRWSEEDSLQFLDMAIKRAGRQTPLFTRAALERLHYLAEGVPRRLKQLADLSLLAGAGQELPSIDADTIDTVFHELGVVHA